MSSSPDDRPTALESPHPGVRFDPDAEGADDLVGVTLQGTYRLARLIGEGGMGKVYEAHHTRIAGKRFAVKVIRAEMAGSPEVRARFQREADAAASISHPNVVAVHDFGYAEDGRPYIVWEFLEGQNLGDWIKQRGWLSLELAAHIARKVTQGVAAAHAQGVIHRDLKPDNVHLIGAPPYPTVKVLDFGLSRFVETTGNSVTRTGIAMGTPSYMAPEQARGERVDQRADVYGVGAIVYTCLTGRPPFSGESVQQTMLAVMSGEPARPRSINPEIPEELELVIQRAMAANPAERFQTLEELDAAFAHFDPTERRDTPPRRQLLSVTSGRADDDEVGSARPQVVFFSALAVLCSVLGVMTLLSGVPALLGRRALSASEFWLGLAVVCGTLLTPGALLVRWFWRRLWNNSVKMLEVLPRLRGPVVGALAAYGLAVLFGRSMDAVAAQAGPAGQASGWPGLAPIHALIALIAGATIFLRRRLLESGAGRAGRMIAGPAMTVIAVVISVGLLHLSQRARLRVLGAAPVASAEPAPSASAAPPLPPPSIAPPPASVAPPAVPTATPGLVAGPRASAEEVRTATAAGVEGLLALSKRFPGDAAVLEPLVVALGSTTEGLARAMAELDTLLRIAPERASDKTLGALVVKAALSPGEASTRALDLMGSRMGSLGADMLYDLMLTSVPLRQATRERLDDPNVRKTFSPALAIAFDLRAAKSCEDRVPLLPRALEQGDSRTVSALIGMSTGAKKGCGAKKRQPCPPTCPAEAQRFRDTALTLQAKLNAKKR